MHRRRLLLGHLLDLLLPLLVLVAVRRASLHERLRVQLLQLLVRGPRLPRRRLLEGARHRRDLADFGPVVAVVVAVRGLEFRACHEAGALHLGREVVDRVVVDDARRGCRLGEGGLELAFYDVPFLLGERVDVWDWTGREDDVPALVGVLVVAAQLGAHVAVLVHGELEVSLVSDGEHLGVYWE